MVFDNEASRDAYFERVEGDLFAVEYGDALRHASTTDLGFWGSEDDLFDDCSRIMLAEVNKFACRERCQIRDIQLSAMWRVLYHSARAKPRRAIAAVYEKLGQANDNKALLEEAAKNRRTPVVLGDIPPYQAVYEDVKRKRRYQARDE